MSASLDSSAVLRLDREPELPFGGDFFRNLLENLYDGVYFVDTEKRILYWNAAAEQITGFTGADVIGRRCGECLLVHQDDAGRSLCLGGCPLASSLITGKPNGSRVSLIHKDGRRIPVDVRARAMRDERGKIVGGVEVFRDASSLIALEQAFAKLRELAFKDPLTGLSNRRHLDDMLDFQLAILTRSGSPFSLVMTDIDHFKKVNDTRGHIAGDQTLRVFASLLESNSRNCDVVGRFGGEEFLILMPGERLEGAERLAERLRLVTELETAPIGSDAVAGAAITASFGVVEAVRGDTRDSILGRADQAVYRAKTLGRNRVERGLDSAPRTVPGPAADPLGIFWPL